MSNAGKIAAGWAVVGFSWILLDAIIRLAMIAYEAMASGLSFLQWALLVVVVLLMAYAEGYRGFQKSFSPRCAARTRFLLEQPGGLASWLAPLFIMGFFRATRKPFLFAWVGTALIVILIILLQISPQPWRGIVDAGVVVGLSWGLISYWVAVWQVMTGQRTDFSHEVPDNGSV